MKVVFLEEKNKGWAAKMRLFYNQTNSGSEPSIYTHYLYDASGNRVKKFTWKAEKWEAITYIDGIIEYREDHDAHLQSISHIMDDTTRIASFTEGYDFGDSTPVLKYYLGDNLGSSNVVLDENGTVVNIEEYYPFGETSFGSYGKKRYRFCGKEKDEESGLYYYGMRYYVPWACRFVSLDPLASKYPFYTPYQYAGNQPINFIDLDGAEQAPAPNDSTSRPTPAADSSSVQSAVDSSSTQSASASQNAVDSSASKLDTTAVTIETKPTDSIQVTKPKPKNVTPPVAEKQATNVNPDFSFNTLKGGAEQSTDYQMYRPQMNTVKGEKFTLGAAKPKQAESKETKVKETTPTSDGDFGSAKSVKERVQAAKDVVTKYRANKTGYSQKNRQFGLNATLADCSSTVTTMLKKAGQGSMFTATSSAGMYAEIQKLSTNNTLRKNDPLPGDIMLWGGHVAIVTEVKNGTVYFGMMGSKAQIGEVPLDRNNSLQEEGTYGHGGFLGFWTPGG